MTDKEMAEEYCNKLFAEKVKNEDYDEYGRLLYRSKEIRDAFLAGLEAGRPKWHKVADGDLPKDENDVLVYSGEDWRMCVGRYSPKYKAWETGCDTIAWCEIPKYTEE